jgi:cation transport regulator ChaC
LYFVEGRRSASRSGSLGWIDKYSESFTELVLYVVPAEFVDDCLAELDFREKGGYARDVIDVIEDETGRTVQAVLYRGTPDNPAIWPRVFKDTPYAAAVLSVASGPSEKKRCIFEVFERIPRKCNKHCSFEIF